MYSKKRLIFEKNFGWEWLYFHMAVEKTDLSIVLFGNILFWAFGGREFPPARPGSTRGKLFSHTSTMIGLALDTVPEREGGEPTGVEGFDEKLLLVWSGE